LDTWPIQPGSGTQPSANLNDSGLLLSPTDPTLGAAPMKTHRIAVIAGDGIGLEVMP